MNTIKFSHAYQKILDRSNDVIETARLLHVQLIDLSNLQSDFIAYDTDDGKYKLPKVGAYLMLIFLKPHEDYVTDLNLFTTLRRYTPEKIHYYKSRIGEEFKVVTQ